MQTSPLPRRAKIVATIGPATQNKAVLRQLIQAGATTFRWSKFLMVQGFCLMMAN